MPFVGGSDLLGFFDWYRGILPPRHRLRCDTAILCHWGTFFPKGNVSERKKNVADIFSSTAVMPYEHIQNSKMGRLKMLLELDTQSTQQYHERAASILYRLIIFRELRQSTETDNYNILIGPVSRLLQPIDSWNAIIRSNDLKYSSEYRNNQNTAERPRCN